MRIALLCAVLLTLLLDGAVVKVRLDRPTRLEASPEASPSRSIEGGRLVDRVAVARVDPRTGRPRRVLMLTSDGADRQSISAFPASTLRGRSARYVHSEIIHIDSSETYACGVAGCSTTSSSSIQAGIAASALDGSKGRLLTEGGHDIAPVVSPDGETIAYLRNIRLEDGTQVRAVALLEWSGQDLALLSPPEGMTYGSVAWSPDGERLAVLRKPVGGARSRASVVAMDRDGRVHEVLARGMFYDLAWSHDGRSMAGVRDRFDMSYGKDVAGPVTGSDLWVIPLDGGRPRNVSRLAGSTSATGSGCGASGGASPRVTTPAWSPDDSRLAFLSSYGHAERLASEVWDLMLVDADGRKRRTILRSPEPRCSRHGSFRERPTTMLAIAGWIQVDLS